MSGTGGWRPGAGRKPIDPEGLRAVRKSYTLREDQVAWVEATAAMAGVSQSDLVRRLIDAHQGGEFCRSKIAKEGTR